MIIAKQPKRGFSGLCDLVLFEQQPAREKTNQEKMNLRSKIWQKDNPKRVREIKAKYHKSENGKKVTALYNATYQRDRLTRNKKNYTHPESKKISDSKYAKSVNGRISHHKAARKWEQSPKGKISLHNYNTSEKGRVKNFNYKKKYYDGAKKLVSQGLEICACCGNMNKFWLQFDHIVPVGETGKKRQDRYTIAKKIVMGIESATDYQLLCGNCNFAKDDLVRCPIDHSLDGGEIHG